MTLAADIGDEEGVIEYGALEYVSPREFES
jgi:hypothetical protein